MTDEITLQNVFYKIRSKGDSVAPFPIPGRKAGSCTRVQINFKESPDFMFLTVDEHVTVDFLRSEDDERYRKPTVIFNVDQTPVEVLNQGLDTDKMDVEGLTNSNAKTSKILNALEYAYFFALGRRDYANDLRAQ